MCNFVEQTERKRFHRRKQSKKWFHLNRPERKFLCTCPAYGMGYGWADNKQVNEKCAHVHTKIASRCFSGGRWVQWQCLLSFRSWPSLNFSSTLSTLLRNKIVFITDFFSDLEFNNRLLFPHSSQDNSTNIMVVVQYTLFMFCMQHQCSTKARVNLLLWWTRQQEIETYHNQHTPVNNDGVEGNDVVLLAYSIISHQHQSVVVDQYLLEQWRGGHEHYFNHPPSHTHNIRTLIFCNIHKSLNFLFSSCLYVQSCLSTLHFFRPF